MRMLFIRINKSKFLLFSGRSSGGNDERMNKFLKSCLSYYFYQNRHKYLANKEDGEYGEAERLAAEVVQFAKKQSEYVFWEIFDFYWGEFSYAAKKELFFENKGKGSTLADVIQEMERPKDL